MKACISYFTVTVLNMIYFSLHVSVDIQSGALTDCLNKKIDEREEPLIFVSF